jgi:hypothetical protein
MALRRLALDMLWRARCFEISGLSDPSVEHDALGRFLNKHIGDPKVNRINPAELVVHSQAHRPRPD